VDGTQPIAACRTYVTGSYSNHGALKGQVLTLRNCKTGTAEFQRTKQQCAWLYIIL